MEGEEGERGKRNRKRKEKMTRKMKEGKGGQGRRGLGRRRDGGGMEEGEVGGKVGMENGIGRNTKEEKGT